METLVKLITALKDFKDARFYCLVILLFMGFIAYTFKDKIQEITFKPQTVQEVSNEKGLMTTLEATQAAHPLIVGYAFYLYQPKVDAYYKTLIWTDIPYIRDNRFFKSIPLNTQKYLNYRLVGQEYALLDYSVPEEKEYAEIYAADYVLVYNVRVKETIAEVILTFNVKPTQGEVDVLLKNLRTIKYFVI